MKKGLLSLLALALTVVGCQNYDDQFDELTSQITSLQSTVDGLTGVSTAITALQSTVAAISTAITSGNAANATANAATAAGLAQVSQTLADLQASLGNVAQAGDLDAISSTLADVQADVRELLEANAVINQNVVINNSATLDYVETLIATGDDDPNVIVNGYVRINTTNLTDAEVTRANAIAAKLATILGNTGVSAPVGREALTATGDDALTFTNLAFVDGDYVVDGADQDDAALRTVSGHLGINHGGVAAAINYSQITSVGGDVAIDPTDAATATSVDFSGTDISGNIHHGAGSALDFPGATTIDLGAASFNSLSAAKATSIVSAMTAVTTGVTIDAANGGTIDFNSLETIGANLQLTSAGTTTFHADALTAVTGTISATGGEVHLPALTSSGNAEISAATAAALTSLVTLTSDLNLYETPAAIFTNLVSIDGNLSWGIGVISLPGADVVGTIVSTVATDVTVAAFDDTIADLPANVVDLTLTAQDIDVVSDLAQVTDLSITAADGAEVDYTADAQVVNVTLVGNGLSENSFPAGSTALKTLSLTDTGSNTIDALSTVVTVTLAGTIIAFDSDAATLAQINNSANFRDIAGTTTGETPITFIVKGTSAITSIDLSSMNKVAVVEITGNSALTEVIAPGTDPQLTPNAGASYTIKTNSIVGTYTGATAAYPGDGVNPATPYAAACLHLPGLSTWPAFIADVQTDNPTAAFAFDYTDGTTADTYGEDIVADTAQTHVTTPTNASEIDSDASLALISATACD